MRAKAELYTLPSLTWKQMVYDQIMSTVLCNGKVDGIWEDHEYNIVLCTYILFEDFKKR
jgi:hypothetical protein